MSKSRVLRLALLPVTLLPACSLLIDTNPDGVIDKVAAGAAGKGTSSTGTLPSAGAGVGSATSSALNPLGGTSNGSSSSATSGGTKDSSVGFGGGSTTIDAAGGQPGLTGVGGMSQNYAGQIVVGTVQIFGGRAATIVAPIAGASDARTSAATGGSAAASEPSGGSAPTSGGTNPASGGQASSVSGGASSTTTTGSAGTNSGCSVGNRDCSNNVPRLCGSNGQWQPQTACSGGTPTCKAGECVCNASSLQCKNDGVTKQLCTDAGIWQDQGQCSGATPYCSGAGVCVQCKEGSKQCNGETPQQCNSSGQWKDQSACSGATPYCNGAGVCAACKEGSKQCSGETPQTCNAGQWQSQTACGGATPYCNGAGLCGACKDNRKQCSGNTPQLCTGGQWQDQTPCSGTTPACTGNGVCGCPNSGGPTMVGLPLGFCIDSTEVTQGQYKAWLNTSPSTGGQKAECSWNTSFAPSSTCMQDPFACNGSCDNYPQTCVDWCDAHAYCRAVGKRLCGKIGGGPTSWPNDAINLSANQWYAACTSNGTYRYPYGASYDEAKCNAVGGHEMQVATYLGCQSPVAAYAGIYDMSANVAEWEDSCDGTIQSTSCRTRGGSSGNADMFLACDGYSHGMRDSPAAALGFRCCAP